MIRNNFYLWGDSIGKGVVYDPVRRRYCLTPQRCERALREEGLCLTSYARMGATVRMGYADFLETQTEPEGVAVIQYGGNDCDLDWQAVSDYPDCFHDGRTPLSEFRDALKAFAAAAEGRGLRPLMVLPPPLYARRYFEWVCRGRNQEAVLRYLGDVEHISRWHTCYVEAIREAAEESGSLLADFYTPFLRAWNYPDLICEDGIHPSQQGQELMTQTALSMLRRSGTLRSSCPRGTVPA